MTRNNNIYTDYVLGLDIGMASVGAALLASDHIIALHVRTFGKAETAKEGESLNKIRREARLARRHIRRRAFRRATHACIINLSCHVTPLRYDSKA